jgi:hypothetical protein
MQKHLLALSLALALITTSLNAGWFSTNTPDADRERLQAEQRLHDAQHQIDAQQQTIMQLHTTTVAFAAGAVILLIVGVALGSKVKRDEDHK